MFAFSLTFSYLFKMLALVLIALSCSKGCGRHSAALRFLNASAGFIVGFALLILQGVLHTALVECFLFLF